VVKSVIDPDGSLDGTVPTNDGLFIASEPQGSPSWFPANDTPTDKATYDIRITAPAGLSAISNGYRVASWTVGGRATTWWLMTEPISTYLVTATIGRFTVRTGHTPAGVPYLTAVDPAEVRASTPVLAKLPAIVDYYSTVFGRYPFGSAGAIVDHAPQVGYALETATRPIFDSAPDELTLAHELAHQWYGDSVTLRRWRDSWLWDEHRGGTSGAAHLAALLATPASNGVWKPPPGNPGTADQIFAGSVYERGAGTLQALRGKLGDRTFFAVLRGWASAHRYGNATVEEFGAYASAVAHTDLSHFFTVWLERPGKPTGW
jgi:aminopeptidase N